MPTAPTRKRDKPTPSARTSKEAWLKLAIDTLVREGIDQVKVQVMAGKLGVSRSSFYWFFESIQDLHNQIVDYWFRTNTSPIIERAERSAATINEAVCSVFECWIDSTLFDPDLDAAMRVWGRHDPGIREIIQDADRRRVNALQGMFVAFGYPQEEAMIRGRVIYYNQIGHFTLQIQESLQERLSHLRSYLLTFTGREPLPGDVEALEALAAVNSLSIEQAAER